MPVREKWTAFFMEDNEASGEKERVFLMTCQRQQAKGQLECIGLLFMYDACSIGYLVTLLSISNRRSRIFSEGRAARSRGARVEPECEGRSITTRREESISSGGDFCTTTVERWCGELHWTVGKEKLKQCADYSEVWITCTASKDAETVKDCHAFSQKIKAWGDLRLDSAGESFLHTSWAADGKNLEAFCTKWGWGVGVSWVTLTQIILKSSTVFLERQRVVFNNARRCAVNRSVYFQSLLSQDAVSVCVCLCCGHFWKHLQV